MNTAIPLNSIEPAPQRQARAIHGTALGGGLEVALGCHYRVAIASAKVGLPEVKLGILPGAGGTQRLPRLIGVETALSIIVSGEPVPAPQAAKAGLIDKIVDGDLLEGAVAYARELVVNHAPLRKVRHINIDASALPADFFAETRRRVAKQKKNLFAPQRIVDTLEAAATVIGAGTMGGGITMNFLNVGIPVTLLETKQGFLDRGIGVIRKNYENTASKGKLTLEQVEQRMALLTPTLCYDDIKDASLIIEAVFETMAIKKEVFGKVDKVAKPRAILASNTSYLSIDEIAQATSRPGDVLGMHFFSPANVMKQTGGKWLQVSPLLERLVAEGKGFASLGS